MKKRIFLKHRFGLADPLLRQPERPATRRFLSIIYLKALRGKIRSRIFPLEVVLFSFVFDAQQGFKCGVNRLIAKLFELEIVTESNGALPARKSYDEACAKLPAGSYTNSSVVEHFCVMEEGLVFDVDVLPSAVRGELVPGPDRDSD